MTSGFRNPEADGLVYDDLPISQVEVDGIVSNAVASGHTTLAVIISPMFQVLEDRANRPGTAWAYFDDPDEPIPGAHP